MRRLPSVPVLEPGVAATLGEERGERGVLMPKGLLKRNRGNIGQKSQIFGLLPLRKGGVGLLVGGGALLGGVAALPFGEGFVPDQAHAAERAAKDRLLFSVGVSPDLVCASHINNLQEGTTMCKRPFLPTAKAGGFLVDFR